METARRRRLVRDFAEMQQKPYPRIKLVPHGLETACLVFRPERCRPLHLTIQFGSRYPLEAPVITIQSHIRHPNVFGDYICASILNKSEGYTPAYTLKGISIQMLSFFNSDSLEQEGGGVAQLPSRRRRRRCEYCHDRNSNKCWHCLEVARQNTWNCPNCDFGPSMIKKKSGSVSSPTVTATEMPENGAVASSMPKEAINRLPDEILLQIMGVMDLEDIILFAQAWPRARNILTSYDVIRSRELQCFAVKSSYKEAFLGIGISLTPVGRQSRIDSEFDLVSYFAYKDLRVRRSVQGLGFEFWMPLPLSHRHWWQVELAANGALKHLSDNIFAAGGRRMSNVGVLFAFMNDVVVRLSMDLEGQSSSRREQWEEEPVKSTLRHASEKAIESYFHLYHLLLCLATGVNGTYVVREANAMIRSFMAGKRGKQHIPNLGHLLVALLISDIEVTDKLRKAIITEAITRNVVWLLDGKGAGMAELGYLEDSKVSQYRLKKTFQGSRTSYRLLMFSELFRRVARSQAGAGAGHRRPTLVQIRDALFARHGAPPEGYAARLASKVRDLQNVDSFPAFLSEMGIRKMPSSENFTGVLRDTIKASVASGYSRDVPQSSLLNLRLNRDEDMDREAAMAKVWEGSPNWQYSEALGRAAQAAVRSGKLSFFPGRRR